MMSSPYKHNKMTDIYGKMDLNLTAKLVYCISSSFLNGICGLYDDKKAEHGLFINHWFMFSLFIVPSKVSFTQKQSIDPPVTFLVLTQNKQLSLKYSASESVPGICEQVCFAVVCYEFSVYQEAGDTLEALHSHRHVGIIWASSPDWAWSLCYRGW